MTKFSYCMAMIGGIAFLVTGAVALQENGGMNFEDLLTQENIDKLNKGKVVLVSQSYKDGKGKMRAKGVAIVVIDSTPQEVWKYLPDFENYPSFMPRMTSARTYLKEAGKVGVDFQIKVLFRKIKYSLLHTIDKENGRLTLKLDATRESDINGTEGVWLVLPHGEEKTLLFHSVIVDSGLAVPKVIEDYLTKKDLPNIVLTMKKRVESGGRYTK